MDAAPISYQPFDAQSVRDADQLRLLSIFHYIGGGLVLAVSCLFIVHVVMGFLFLTSPGTFGPNPPPPGEARFMGVLFMALGSAALLCGWALGALTIYSGRCIGARRYRLFSLILAGFLCLQVPIGTALGVFTFVVLLRDSVRAEYERGRRGARMIGN